MMAYFARRLVGGIITLFLITLAMYSLLVYGPGDVLAKGGASHCCDHPVSSIKIEEQEAATLFGTAKPWPLNYVTWLFNPDETTEIVFVEPDSKVEDMFGVAMLIVILTLPISMAVVAVQRRRRLLIPGLPNYPQSRNLLHLHAHPKRILGV